VSLSDLLDPHRSITHAIGRPRRALWMGGVEGAAIAESRGAVIVHDGEPRRGSPNPSGSLVGEPGRVSPNPSDQAAGSAEPFDLAFVCAPAMRGDVDALLARAVPRLEDGGHVILHHGSAMDGRALLPVLSRAGLEPVFRDGNLLQRSTLLVARRPPLKRKLSLTVGMISMNEEGAVGKVIDGIK
jgi:hypothetical protein